MGWGQGRIASLALVVVIAVALAASASLAGVRSFGRLPRVTGPPPLGIPEADATKNCFLPGETVTFLLRNVGTGTLFYGYVPNFVVWNATTGYVREALDGYPHVTVKIPPGGNITWNWDGRWERFDGTHKGELVPPADYVVIIQTLSGYPQPELVEIAQAPFSIGACEVQITAGDDFVVDEGQPFAFHPTIAIPGNATVTSITWDLDPAGDANGDGNMTNDVDFVGESPELIIGDDGAYPAVMTVRGFGTLESKTRVDQDVVLSIQSSASMETSDPSRLRKAGAKAYVDRLAPDDRAAVVGFNGSAKLLGGHLSTNYSAAKAAIDTIGASGGCFLAGGFRLGLNELKSYGNTSHQWLEIFFTDGQTTDPRDVFEIPRAIEFAQDLGVPIYVIGLRITDPDVEARVVKIANETGGEYFPAMTPDVIDEIIATIAEDVNSTEERFFAIADEVVVLVRNVAPTVGAGVDVTEAPPANVTLRVAGEKWHDITMTLYRDGGEVGNVTVFRTPGSPDEQSRSLFAPLYAASNNTARVVYTPEDDPVSGTANGADPAWVNVTLANGTFFTYHHTFNVEHPDSWVWEIDLTNASGAYVMARLAASIHDPGTDDETVVVDWGDGANETYFVYNDGVGPDPFPSPWGDPVNLTFEAGHAYRQAGTYTVTLTVTDDDGGQTVVLFAVDVT